MGTKYLYVINVLIGIRTEYLTERKIKKFFEKSELMCINFIFLQDRFAINLKAKIATC